MQLTTIALSFHSWLESKNPRLHACARRQTGTQNKKSPTCGVVGNFTVWVTLCERGQGGSSDAASHNQSLPSCRHTHRRCTHTRGLSRREWISFLNLLSEESLFSNVLSDKALFSNTKLNESLFSNMLSEDSLFSKMLGDEGLFFEYVD